MLYYEEAEVKQYFRKDSKGNKKPYYQIGIKKKSKFNEAKSIALVDIAEIKEVTKNFDVNKITELKTNLKETSEEVIELKQQLQEYKEANSKLTSENYELQQELLHIKEENEAEVKELSSKLFNEKDLTKSLLVIRSDLLNRSLINRIRNKEPESSKMIAKIKELPEVNVKDISEN